MSKARCFLIFFLFLCGIVAGSVFLFRAVIKDTTVTLFESLRGNGLFPPEALVDYDKISMGISFDAEASEGGDSPSKGVFPRVKVLLEGFSISEKSDGMKLRAETIDVTYGITENYVSIKFPKCAIDIVNVGTAFGEGQGDLHCSASPILAIELRDNILLAAVKKLLMGKKDGVEGNRVVSFSYIDTDGISCKNLKTGEDVSVYHDARFKFGVVKDNEVHADAEINTKVRPEGKLSFKVSDVAVRFFSDNGKLSDISILHARLWGDDFSSTLSGRVVLSERCGYVPFNICEFDLNVGMEGYDSLWAFLEGLLEERALFSENSSHSVVSRPTFSGIKKVVRDIAVIEDEDRLALSLKKVRNGGITLGNTTFEEFLNAVDSVVAKEAQNDSSASDSGGEEQSVDGSDMRDILDLSGVTPEDLGSVLQEE